MAVRGSCHCGAVRIEVPSAPDWAASCNCSICRRLGSLVAYYPDTADGRSSLEIDGATASYVHGDRMIEFRFCPNCHCFLHWEPTAERFGRTGVNARLLDGFAVTAQGPTFDGKPLELRFFDNAER